MNVIRWLLSTASFNEIINNLKIKIKKVMCRQIQISGGKSMGYEFIIAVGVATVVIIMLIVAILSRYRKCPSDKVLVIYGKVGADKNGQARSAKCIHGGAAFIVPIIQSYQYMDLTPISINVDLRNALSKQNIRVDVPSRFTVGISTEPGIMQNAAERLLGLKMNEIQELAKDIILGQLRLVIATMEIEEINSDRDKFLISVSNNVEIELKKIGLRLINVNVTDINDESGYIEALGKEAAAKAINDAKKSVAEKDKDGEIGQANARREQRIQVAAADAAAIKGENEAKIEVALSEAARREKEAEALKIATAAEQVQAAKAKEEAYVAQKEAEQTRAELERATQQADIIIKAQIAKEQAAGMKQLVDAAGGDADAAVKFIVADKLQELMQIQVDAIKNIKIDKVTVWDSMNGNGDGTPTTANFLSGMMKSIPPMNELFKQAGMELPTFMGKDINSSEKNSANTDANVKKEVKVTDETNVVSNDDAADNKNIIF